jgi:hypothetical protein
MNLLPTIRTVMHAVLTILTAKVVEANVCGTWKNV